MIRVARRGFAAVLLTLILAVPAAVPRAQGAFVFPDSDRRLLTQQDLGGRSCNDLSIARNEIYARRGRYFERADLTAYFSRFPWYRPYTWNPQLNRIEQANVALITQHERGC